MEDAPPNDEVLSECLRQQKSIEQERKEEEAQSWMEKHLHGIYPLQTEEVAVTEVFYQWLENAVSLWVDRAKTWSIWAMKEFFMICRYTTTVGLK